MGFSKCVLFLLTNLIAFNFNLASEDSNMPEKIARASLFRSRNNGGIDSRTNRISRLIENYGEDISEVIIKARAVYWIPTTCDSLAERGYTCYGCSESLHCMANNFALKAICGGRRPFCFNGVCSDLRGEKCTKTHSGAPAQAGAVVHDEFVEVHDMTNSTVP